METESVSQTAAQQAASWTPIAVICLAQTLGFFNIAGLSAAIGPIVAELGVSATVVQAAIVVYTLVPAALLILGGKAGASFLGLLGAFRTGLVLYAAGMVVVATAPSGSMFIAGEAVTGIGACVLAPTFIGMVAAYYRGQQQAAAVGFLGAAVGIGGVLGSLGGGALTSLLGWRVLYFAIAGIAALTLVLSAWLSTIPKPPRRPEIDWCGAGLSALGILLLILGVNQIGSWGFLIGKAAAPARLFGLSPVPFMMLGGVLCIQAFFVRQEARVRRGKDPLLSPQVLDTPLERAAITGLILHQAIFGTVNLVLPLYTQLVQSMTPFGSAMVFLPWVLATIAGALLAARLGARFAPRPLAFVCFLGFTASLMLVAITVSNQWGNVLTILGLGVSGLSYGVVGAVLSTTIVSASPPELGSDVGGLRGAALNMGTSLSTALAGAIVLSVLIGSGGRLIEVNPQLGSELRAQLQLDLSKVKFMSNAQLKAILDRRADVNDRHKAELVAINEQARLDALRVAFLFASGLAVLGVIASRKLPRVTISGQVTGSDGSSGAAERLQG